MTPEMLDAMAAFPARAGMIRCSSVGSGSRNSVPRTRGDDPTKHPVAGLLALRSPHARG